jgi:arsenical pump membrane protein
MRRAAPRRHRPARKPPQGVYVAATAARARGILAASNEEGSISSLTPSAPLATVIFLVTIALVITRPRGLTEARAALLGAVVMVLAGLLPLGDAASNVGGHWNVLLFFVGLTGAAAIAERSGLFEVLAGTSARLSGGSPRRLLVAVVLAGALVAALLSNDAAALVLTPVVYVLVARFGLEPLPYVLACTFVADAASLALPVSNPVNVIVSDRLGVSAVSLVPVLLPAAIAAVVALLGCLLVIYRRRLPAAAPILPAAESWASWAGVPRPLLAAFGLSVVVFAIASALDVPLGPTLTAAWLFLLLVERRCGREVGPLEGIGWSLLVFVAAMGVLVDGLSSAGVTAWLASLVLGPVRDLPAAVMAVSAAAAAVGANLFNNLPAAFVLADAVHGAGLGAASAHAAAIGTIIGADLGPNLTPVGSVATLLWFVLLRQRGLEVSTWSYIRVGLIVTPITILAALAVGLLLGVPR